MLTKEYKDELVSEYKELKTELETMDEERQELSNAIRESHNRLMAIREELISDMDMELGVEGLV